MAKDDIRRKTLKIDQIKLDRVRELLKAKTETAAIDQALGLALLRQELVAGVRRIAGLYHGVLGVPRWSGNVMHPEAFVRRMRDHLSSIGFPIEDP